MARSPPPLSGVRVLELAGLAPAPFAGLVLADFGAEVLRVDRPNPSGNGDKQEPSADQLTRHKSSLVLDLKDPRAISLLRSLINKVDVLIDPFRPGVLESLGLAPDTLLKDNPRLIFARLTGFRRDGPYANAAGHDINFLAVSGVLSQLGRKGEPPYAPGNIIADFGAGGIMCAMGVLLALIKRDRTGKGQIVEANMVDGTSYLGTFARLARHTPFWDRDRGENILDGGCPFYNVYECKDGKFVAVGPLEPKFFQQLLRGLDMDEAWAAKQYDRSTWPEMKTAFEQQFKTRSRGEWEGLFKEHDGCCTPVLELDELRETSYEQRAAVQLSASPALPIPKENAYVGTPLYPGEGGAEMLSNWTGWTLGREFDVNRAGLFTLQKSRL